jgi:excisionase family DNA binding protein
MLDSQVVNEAAENKKLISATEAAERLGVSRPTITRLIQAKRLACYRIGSRVLFDDSILENYLATVYQPPADAKLSKRRTA